MIETNLIIKQISHENVIHITGREQRDWPHRQKALLCSQAGTNHYTLALKRNSNLASEMVKGGKRYCQMSLVS